MVKMLLLTFNPSAGNIKPADDGMITETFSFMDMFCVTVRANVEVSSVQDAFSIFTGYSGAGPTQNLDVLATTERSARETVSPIRRSMYGTNDTFNEAIDPALRGVKSIDTCSNAPIACVKAIGVKGTNGSGPL